MSLSIVLIGLLVGFLVGLTGVGGATLLTPILLVLGVNPSIAVGTDLFYNSITKFFGIIKHWQQKSINFQLVKYFSMGSVPSAAMAITFLHFYNTQDREAFIKHTLGYVLIAVSISMLFRIFFDEKMKLNAIQLKAIEEKRVLTVGLGALFGVIVGMTSIGAGSLFAVAMFYLYRVSAVELVGTDITHAFILVTVAGLLNASFGNVNYLLAGNLLIGSIPGVLLASGLSTKVPTRSIRTILGVVILISALEMI
ncbi:sulfite exporter TauE/SafE family protein [Desulfitobacterium metallireducens]|uniref:Probable membrane transporter protein n=1 Tax=Desulfitobacterium metallireducens DSM 15288 TaxID=871968 RepID=W0EG66_9FIRM|nr:sulfite exporter TauE/SafE family protein [Desulfitobacterium metallireducens]AHF08066.1 membrane protein [Desulfitobacterium metallireducens DSM 15288]